MTSVFVLSSVAFAASKTIYHDGWIDLNKNGVMDPYENPKLDIEERIDYLLSIMTLEEKTCQLATLYGYQRVLKDDLPTPEWKNEVWKDGIGAIDEHLNSYVGENTPSDNPNCWPASAHAKAINEVQRFFVEETRLGIPVDFTNESVRGVESYIATDFPIPLGQGSTWNRHLVREIGRIVGKEARVLGYTNIYAPILDVGRDQRWGRFEEVYGESPYLVSQLGTELARGLQQNYQVASTAKHFAIYSNNSGAREDMARTDPRLPLRETHMLLLRPFKEVIQKAGILGVMSSYNDYDGIPISGSRYYLTTLLRETYGFKGYVVSDSDALKYLWSKHHVAATYKEAVRQAVDAGMNVRCTFSQPKVFINPLRELVREGKLSMSTVDSRVRDVLRVKFGTGIFDHPYVETPDLADQIVNCRAHRDIAIQASRESLVLLKNNNDLLPLDKKLKSILVCGPNADETSYALTRYGPHAVEVITVLEGIRNKLGSTCEIRYTKGCDIVDERWPESEILPIPLTDSEQEEIGNAVRLASESDVAIVVLGGSSKTCGESRSRTSLDLPGRQLDLVQAIYATGKPVVVVLINGRPLSINWVDAFVPAIIEAWYPGSQGGTAIADVLFGDFNPGGKLTCTFPKTAGQIPMNFPCKPNAQIDTKKPRARVNGIIYPFGYGLSYTKFEYSNLMIMPKTNFIAGDISVSFEIKNTGEVTGDEVVQLYVRDLVSSVTTYEKNLRGFERVHLNPKEKKKITMTLTSDDLMLLDRDMNWVVEPGDFQVMVGSSSEDIRLEDRFTLRGIEDDQE